VKIKFVFILIALAVLTIFSCTNKTSGPSNAPTNTPTITNTGTPTSTDTPVCLATVTITPAGICKVFGNTDPAASWQTEDRTTMGKFTLATQQTATRIYFYGGNNSYIIKYKIGIYSDNSNFPGTLLTSMTDYFYTNGRGWYEIDINDIVLNAGDYWLAFGSTDNSSLYGEQTSGGTGGIYTIQNTVLPADFSAYSTFDESYTGNNISSFVACN
jgi:hypothetical protein